MYVSLIEHAHHGGHCIHSQALGHSDQSGDTCRSRWAYMPVVVLESLHEVGHDVHSQARGRLDHSGDTFSRSLADRNVVVLARLDKDTHNFLSQHRASCTEVRHGMNNFLLQKSNL